jgi:hypothetical protein
MNTRALFGLVVVLTAVAPVGVWAQTPPQKQKEDPVTAADWNRRGVELRRSGEHEKALEAFQRADAIARTPKSRAQMGIVEHDLGKFVPAEEHLTEALDARNDAWVTEHRKDIVAVREKVRQHLGNLQLSGGQPGALVTIQAKPIGKMPIDKPIRVEEGETLITVTAPGWLTWQQRIKVKAGSDHDVKVDLVPDRQTLPDITPPPPLAPQAGSGAPPRSTSPVNLTTEAPTKPEVKSYRQAGWIVIGAGVAIAAASAAYLVATRKDCGDVECGRSAPEHRGKFGGAGLVGGALIGAGGVVLLNW